MGIVVECEAGHRQWMVLSDLFREYTGRSFVSDCCVSSRYWSKVNVEWEDEDGKIIRGEGEAYKENDTWYTASYWSDGLGPNLRNKSSPASTDCPSTGWEWRLGK